MKMLSIYPVRFTLLARFWEKKCLAKWTTPFGMWEYNSNGRWEEEQRWLSAPFIQASRAADYPMCRGKTHLKPRFVESVMGLEARLMVWDRAYEKAYSSGSTLVPLVR